MREAGKRLINRNRLGRDFFPRGIPEKTELDSKKQYSATLYDLLSAYAIQRQRTSISHVTIEKRQVWSLQDARDILITMIGDLGEWTTLDRFLLNYLPSPAMRTTVMASSFAATLELVREGKLKIRQESAFAPIYMKKSAGPKDQSTANGNG